MRHHLAVCTVSVILLSLLLVGDPLMEFGRHVGDEGERRSGDEKNHVCRGVMVAVSSDAGWMVHTLRIRCGGQPVDLRALPSEESSLSL